ncbi:MAG: hypothetical protein VZR30_04520 [Acutalibacteraceae bacterium]|nr:hypothetical protein [Acutalibacteraceae bacterium]
MIKEAYIWRKSIWDNKFKCTKCGRQLFVVDKNDLGDAVIIGNTVFCNCGYSVAMIELVDVPDEAKGLMGDIEEYRRRKNGGEQ